MSVSYVLNWHKIRRALHIDTAVTRPIQRTTYWLDIGNNAASGQYILGQPLNSPNRRRAARLRTHLLNFYPRKAAAISMRARHR